MEGYSRGWTWPWAHGQIETDWNQGDTRSVRVTLNDEHSPMIVVADVRGGRVLRLEYSARSGERIRHSLIRSPNLVAFFERWAVLVEGMARAWEGDYPKASGITPSTDREELLAALESELLKQHRQSRPTRLRGTEADELVARVAHEYREALAAGDPRPRVTIGKRLGYSPEHIGRLLIKARRRRPPLLGPAKQGRAGEEKA